MHRKADARDRHDPVSKAAAPAVSVEGVREVNRALRKVGAGTKEMSGLHRTIARAVAPEVSAEFMARTSAPTGKLAASMRPRATARKASVVSTLVYAPIIEYGWPARGIAATGSAAAVLERRAAGIVEQYSREVGGIIDRAMEGI